MKSQGLYILILFLFSCSAEEETQQPENLISSDKMVPLLVDLQLMESYFKLTYQQPERYKKSLDSSSELIFEHYQVSRADFDSSYTWYASNPDLIYQLYEAALDSVNFKLSSSSVSSRKEQ